MPTKRAWCGDAVDRPQIDIYEFTENAVNVLAEGSDLAAVINHKRVPIELPAAVEDDNLTAPGDTGGIPAILQAIEAAINSSTIPEFAELVAAVENPDDDPESPYYRLSVTTREEFVGQPFVLELDAPNPTIDVDVVQPGGPGVNDIQTYYITPAPTGGTYPIRWNLGAGLETSGMIPFDGDAADIKAACVAGMPSITEENLTVTGAGTETDPWRLALGDDLAETAVGEISIDVSALTGNGQVQITTLQNGGAAGSGSNIVTDTFTDTDSTALSAHTADTAHTWTQVTGTAEPDILTNRLRFRHSTLDNGTIEHTLSGVVGPDFTAEFTTDGTVAGGDSWAIGLIFRRSDANNYWYAYVSFFYPDNPTGGNPEIGVHLYKKEGGTVSHIGSHSIQNPSPFTLDGTFKLTVAGSSIDVIFDTGYYVLNVKKTHSFNSSATTVGLWHNFFWGLEDRNWTTFVDDLTFDNVVVVNEKWAISTNGEGGTFDIDSPSASPQTLSAGATTAQVKSALEALYAGSTFTVTGSGVPSDPWIAEDDTGSNLTQPTGDGTNLTGGFDSVVDVVQDGSPPLPTIWDVTIHNASSGNFQFGFKGRKTTDIALGATAATVKAAFDALAPGDFTDLFTVVDTGIGSADYRITAAGRLVGEALTLIAHNEDLVGTAQEINHYTLQAATGRHWIDNPTNWKDIATGLRGLPEDGDELFVQTGDESNSIRYGALTGIALKRFIKSSLFSGEMGLPERTQTGYVEYRETAIPLEFENGTQSFENPNVLIGIEQGQGSGLVRIKTGTSKVHIRVERTGGPAEEGRPSFCWDGQNAENTLELIEGYVGTAVFAFTTASLARCVQRGGLLRFGEGTAIGAGGFDRVNGETVGRCTVGGVPLILGG